MHPYPSLVLQNYYRAIGWNEDNLYSNLTRASNAILDFKVPSGINFHISKAPNKLFNTTYSMNALPTLNGSLGYIFTTCDLHMRASQDVRLKDIMERFKIYDLPRKPEGKPEQWLNGERVDTRDYLLYGRYYIPSARLDALYTTRLTPTLQALISVISDPSSGPIYVTRAKGGGGLGGANNVMAYLQHDTGRWSTEYTWSADDGMWGARVLHNFGKLAGEEDERERGASRGTGGEKRVDEEDAMEGGLRGRFSAGAEFYVSLKEKSAGVSTGVRFTTLPDPAPTSSTSSDPTSPSSPSPSEYTQPPTTLTATFNPMMGHISTAYAARVSKDLSLCSRFDFNMYSYESEWAMGAEWWVRRGLRKVESELEGAVNSVEPLGGVEPGEVAALTVSSSPQMMLISTPSPSLSAPFTASGNGANGVPPKTGEVQGVVKARMSTSSNISLMWEGRIGKTLIGLGVSADFSNRSKPISTMGLELAYFSSD
ncbi:mitochondrial distribution and morphology protein 10 [Clavulina sp. PMI_390]|nr:mitochondrial distribution and morphology protein 10 [Clavulina sp. PMI_390]